MYFGLRQRPANLLLVSQLPTNHRRVMNQLISPPKPDVLRPAHHELSHAHSFLAAMK
jgi:hypothetical protein